MYCIRRATMTMKDFLESGLFAGLMTVLLLAPFPFGSVQDGWVFFLEISVCLLLMFWIAAQIAGGRLAIIRTNLWVPLLLLAGYLLFTLLPLPSGLLRLLSEETARIYGIGGSILGQTGTSLRPVNRIALDPFEAEGEILKWTAYAIFFFLSLHACRKRRRFVAAYSLLIITGTTVALLGIAQSAWPNGKIYWIFNSGSGMPFGPFANHNHFAGYVELALGLCIGMFLAEIEEFRKLNPAPEIRSCFAWLWRPEGARIWMLFLSLFILLTGLAASMSRGGVLSFLIRFRIILHRCDDFEIQT
jgi:hypothetical protein